MSFEFARDSKKNRNGGDGGTFTSEKCSSLAPHTHITNSLNMRSPDHITHLQSAIDNHAVQRLVHSKDNYSSNVKGFDFAKIGIIQPKLKMSQPADESEQEADNVAEQVMRMSVSDSVASMAIAKEDDDILDRKCTACEMKEDEENRNISRKPSTILSCMEDTNEVASDIRYIRSSSGSPLDSDTKEFMESRFGGYDFSNVRIHADERAASSAQNINALAYTIGNNIVFAEGKYQPNTTEGKRLLAHELVHTVQQQDMGNRSRTRLTNENPDMSIEQGADNIAEAAPIIHDSMNDSFIQSPLMIHRACGSMAIGSPSGCSIGADFGVFLSDLPIFRFTKDCDEFAPLEEAALITQALAQGPSTHFEIHGFASIEGSPQFNSNLACARALKARSILTAPRAIGGAGIDPRRISLRIVNHGPTPGPAPDRRSVVIRMITPGPIIRPVERPVEAPESPCLKPTNPDRFGRDENPTVLTASTAANLDLLNALRAHSAATEAESASKSSGLNGPHLGPQDAFRHCVWNCLMAQRLGTSRIAKKFGTSSAEFFATAYENSGPSGNILDDQMDLHNNVIGRSLGRPGTNCSDACMAAVNDGRLRTVRESLGVHGGGSWICMGASNQPWP